MDHLLNRAEGVEGSATGWLQPGFVQIVATGIRCLKMLDLPACWADLEPGSTFSFQDQSSFPRLSASHILTVIVHHWIPLQQGPTPRPTEPESVFEPNSAMTQIQQSLERQNL